ncbi:MAG: hypothetical protein P8144_01055 [Gammaproteobacteria bacterium]
MSTCSPIVQRNRTPSPIEPQCKPLSKPLNGTANANTPVYLLNITPKLSDQAFTQLDSKDSTPLTPTDTSSDDSDEPESHALIPQHITFTSPSLAEKLPDWIYHRLRNLPKVIHHLHVKGSTPLILLIHDRLTKNQNIRHIPTSHQLANELSIRNHQTSKSAESGELMAQPDLATYREQYAALSNISKTPKGALLTYYQLMLEQAAHGVTYVEFRTGLPQDCDPEEFILNSVRGCQEAQRHLVIENKSIDFGILLLINRGNKTHANTQSGLPENVHRGLSIAQTAIALRQAGHPIVGIDLAGNEKDHAVTDFAPVFKRIHAYNANPNTSPDKRLGITIHAGETKSSRDQAQRVLSGYESVAAAVDLGWSRHTPLRIGHGAQIIGHPAIAIAFSKYRKNTNIVNDPIFRQNLFRAAPLLRTLHERQICLETCPTSNVQTNAVNNYEQHPVRFFDALGLSVTVNPDNTIISQTDATNEYVNLFKHQGFYLPKARPLQQKAAMHRFESFMNRCYIHGIRAAFIFNELKKEKLLSHHVAFTYEHPDKYRAGDYTSPPSTKHGAQLNI